MSAESEAAPFDDRALTQSRWSEWIRLRATWVLALDIVLIAFFTAMSNEHVFWSEANAQSLLISATQALLLALGLSMMLGAGIFDLSLGANLVLSSVVGATVIRRFQDLATGGYDNPWRAIALGLVACCLTGMVYGLVNGLLIAVAGVNSLIATLATMGIGTGIAYLVTDGSDVSGVPPVLQTDIGLRSFGFMPLPAVFAIAATVLLWAVVRYTRYGLRTQAIGSSRAAALRTGIRVRPHLISLAVLGGLLAGIAGFVDLSRFGSTALAGHGNDALAAVTAVVIGGTLLEGGHISIVGTVWGTGLAVILQTGLVILGVQSFWQLIVVGFVLLLAVIADRITTQRRAKGRPLRS